MKKNRKSITKYLIYTGLYLAVLILMIVFGIMPQYNNLSKNQKDLNLAKSDLNTATKKRASLEDLSKDKSKIDQIKQTVFEYLPDSKNNSDFVVKVEALSKELSITIDTFSFTEVKTTTPAKTDSSDNNTSSQKNTSSTSNSTTSTQTTKKEEPKNYSEFSISLSADYGAIMQFIEKLESFPRINSIDSITVSGYDKSTGKLGLRLTGRIYYGK
jgi:Tfp pilus assembly protein PilO